MLHKIENIKTILKLNFDDEIESKTIICQYTHWVDNKPMFLIGIKLPNCPPRYEGYYITGLAKLKKFMIEQDLINKYNL